MGTSSTCLGAQSGGGIRAMLSWISVCPSTYRSASARSMAHMGETTGGCVGVDTRTTKARSLSGLALRRLRDAIATGALLELAAFRRLAETNRVVGRLGCVGTSQVRRSTEFAWSGTVSPPY